ncbi:MAG: patatin-like phospholipase family protein [Pseudomonadota bacterium]
MSLPARPPFAQRGARDSGRGPMAVARRTLRTIAQAAMLAGLFVLPAYGAEHPRVAATSAGQAPSAGPTSARPIIGLVLSGGGARGMAHLGVLRELERLRVPVDIVVGTSFGAVIGGAYASGADLAELEALVRQVPWDSVLQDRPPRDDLGFRRREEDRLVSSRFEMGVGGDGLSLPMGAFSSLEVERLLRQVAPAGVLHRVEDLPLTYRAVATDMLSGDMVVPVGVSLFTAMRASMAVPGAFAPITVDGRVLGDGGLVNNLPVQLARELGAEVVIAVNLGTPLGGRETLSSALGMAQQMLNILTEQNVQRSLRELSARDVLITPDLTGVQFMDFGQVPGSVAAGAEAARAAAERLAPGSVDAAEFTAFTDRRRALQRMLTSAPPVAAAVRVETPDGADGQAAARAIADAGLRVGDPLVPDRVSDAAVRLQQQAGIERVDVLIDGNGAARSVVLLPVTSRLGTSRVRFGVELESDADRRNDFTVSGLYTRGSLNSWGADWRTLARVGAVAEVQTEWHQPLGTGSPWFVSARAGTRSIDAVLYDDFRPRREISALGSTAALTGGVRVLEAGQVRLGVQRRHLRLRSRIPEEAEDIVLATGSRFADFTYDTLDSLGFPTRGQLLIASYESFGIDPDEQVDSYVARVDALAAYSRGPWSGHVYAVGLTGSLARSLPLSLGGFLRLSGAPPDSVIVDQLGFGRLVMAREIGRLSPALGGAVRVGGSLEIAHEFYERAGRTFAGGSAFTAVETRFGPLYLAIGHTHEIGTTVYLYLGSVLLPNGLVR